MWIELLQESIKAWNFRVGKEFKDKIVSIQFVQNNHIVHEEHLKKNNKIIGSPDSLEVRYEIGLKTNTLLFHRQYSNYVDTNRYKGFEKIAEKIVKGLILGGVYNDINQMEQRIKQKAL